MDLLRSGLCLDIAIVGGGIAGLSSAIALRQAGHRVTVYEASRFANEVGAAIHLAPNASKILKSFGFDFDRANVIQNVLSTSYDGVTLEQLTHRDLSHMREIFGSSWYLCHRVDAHNELKRLAFGDDGPGVPAALKTASKVVSINAEQGLLTLIDGDTVEADVIIGADGIHSRTVRDIAGDHSQPTSTGHSAFRFLVQTQTLMEDPDTRWLVDRSELPASLFIAHGKRLAVYPCRRGNIMNFVAIIPDKAEQRNGDGWDGNGLSEDLLEAFQDFNPKVVALLRHCLDLNDLKLWQLLYRPPMRPWVKGVAVAIGDAVHPMLPLQFAKTDRAQGGAQSIEDGAALGILLSNMTTKSEIHLRLRLFEKMRHARTSAIQILSNVGYDEVEQVQGSLEQYVNGEPLVTRSEHQNYLFRYSVQDHAHAVTKEAIETPVFEKFGVAVTETRIIA